MSAGAVGIFGGTFNPVHNGHLRSALELRETLGLDEVRLLPAAVPPHRQAPDCPAAARAEMVRLAVADTPGLVCDTRELERAGPSWTMDSLLELRGELGGELSLCLAIGTDAVAELASWHRWRELLDCAHIVVIARPGWQLPQGGEVARWLQQHLVPEATDLRQQAHGSVQVQQLRQLDISATDIRRMIAAGHSPQYLVPECVWRFIQDRGLYGAAN